MRITFLRHAIAQEVHTDDFSREITPVGRKQVENISKFCHLNGLIPSMLLASPYIRTMQTAEILTNHIVGCPSPTPVEWFRVESNTDETMLRLYELSSYSHDIWLVGHEPNISLLIEKYIGARSGTIQIERASLTRLEVNIHATPKLMWSITHDLIGRAIENI